MDPVVDIIIPTYKPGEEFVSLIEALEGQSIKPNKIIVMNTEEKYFESLKYFEAPKYGKAPLNKYSNIEVHHLSLREFDHGRTRNRGVQKSRAPYFVCMTQDALPADEYLLENLLKPLLEGSAQISYARQLPRADCDEIERFTRAFNYPAQSWEDIEKMGIKAFFCSNVCAAYERRVFEESGGFIRHTIFNEDMIYASGVVRAGGRIAYAADAQVVHSHNYNWIQNFHRNFDLGVSHAQYPEVFAGLRSESEGIKLVKQTARYLWENGKGGRILTLLWRSGWKFLGYRLGKNYKRLPPRVVSLCSMNQNYWK